MSEGVSSDSCVAALLLPQVRQCLAPEGCEEAEEEVRKARHGHSRRGFVGRQSKTYTCWMNMVHRCHMAWHPEYRLYGARGIFVSPRWRTFENFLADMGEKPLGLSLDRIDNNAGYSRENCRWATAQEQTINRRIVKHIAFNGNTNTIDGWAVTLGLNRTTLDIRLRRGWTVERALGTPVIPRRKSK